MHRYFNICRPLNSCGFASGDFYRSDLTEGKFAQWSPLPLPLRNLTGQRISLTLVSEARFYPHSTVWDQSP